MDIVLNGTKWLGFEPTAEGFSDLLKASGVSEEDARGPWLQSIKATAIAEIVKTADDYRARIASTSAGKLAELQIKEEIARDPAMAAAAELGLIEREAIARGMTRDDLIDLINLRAQSYRYIALLIAAIEAEANGMITAIPDDADDIETKIQTVLEAAKAQAETAFKEAIALIYGGS